MKEFVDMVPVRFLKDVMDWNKSYVLLRNVFGGGVGDDKIFSRNSSVKNKDWITEFR